MRNISMSKLGRASMISAIAALSLITLGANAQARVGHWGHWHYAPSQWWHGPVYGYRYNGWPRDYAPPIVYGPPANYAPPAYYGPPAANFGLNVPLG